MMPTSSNSMKQKSIGSEVESAEGEDNVDVWSVEASHQHGHEPQDDDDNEKDLHT